MKRWPLIASFVLFIALCASVAYWAMQLLEPPLRPIAAPPPSTQAAPDISAAAALLGGRGNMAVASNFTLQGVVMSGSPAQSVAILTADGKAPKAVRVGSEIMPGVTVKEVQRGYVMLSDNGALQRVELPAAVDAMGAQGGTTAPVSVRGAEAAAPPTKSSLEGTGSQMPTRTAPAAPPTVVVSPPPSRPSTPAPNQPSNPASIPSQAQQQQPPAPAAPQAPAQQQLQSPAAQPSAPETASPTMPAAPTPAPAATPSTTPSAAANSGATGLPGQNAPGTPNPSPATNSPPPQ